MVFVKKTVIATWKTSNRTTRTANRIRPRSGSFPRRRSPLPRATAAIPRACPPLQRASLIVELVVSHFPPGRPSARNTAPAAQPPRERTLRRADKAMSTSLTASETLPGPESARAPFRRRMWQGRPDGKGLPSAANWLRPSRIGVQPPRRAALAHRASRPRLREKRRKGRDGTRRVSRPATSSRKPDRWIRCAV